MQKHYLIKRDSRYYYFHNSNNEIVKSPVHCVDEARISMPGHQRDDDGFLKTGQEVYLHIEYRDGRTYIYPSHDVYEYLPAKRPSIRFSQTPQSDKSKLLRRRIYHNLSSYAPSKLWAIDKYIAGAFDNSDDAIMRLAEIAGESLYPEESETVEYKACEEELNKPEVLLTIGAFANHLGGTITLGIADDLQVVGCEKLISKFGTEERFALMLRNLIKQTTNENANIFMNVTIEFEKAGEHTLCHICVPKSDDIVLVKNELYVRCGTTSQLLTGDRMINFICKHSSNDKKTELL